MSKFRPWAFWRQFQYGAGFTTFWVIIGVIIYYINSYVPPNCFDNMQNGTEGGVDCGGSCVRICAVSAIEPRVISATSFRITDGQYNALAYVENTNPSAGVPEFRYTFTLLDSGSVIAEQTGITALAPSSVVPIFAGRIATRDGRVPTETRLTFEPVELWLPGTVTRNQFRAADFTLSDVDTRPRLNATIENTILDSAQDIEVVATIFDAAGKPLTASQTYVDALGGRSRAEVVFTWPNSIAKTVRSCEIPSDIMVVLDRSGSMAADGGEPPEPLESAKRAAAQFVMAVQNNNLVGFLSYATTPSMPIEQTLTSDKQAVTTAITAVTMGEDGVQYTNMGDAFKYAQAELESERHRDNARKIIVFLTDGDVTRPVNPETNDLDRDFAAAYALEMAALAKAEDTTIYTIGFGDFLSEANENRVRDQALIRDLASEPSLYFEAPTAADLETVYQKITSGLCEEGPTRIEVTAKPKVYFPPLQ